MSYEPRGKVKLMIDHMRTQHEDVQWSTEELAQAGGLDIRAVATQLKAAVKNRAIYRQRMGRFTVYSLTPFEAPPEPEDEPMEFNAALYLDGDLVVYGAQANEDGSFTVSAAQVAKLKKLIAWSPAA